MIPFILILTIIHAAQILPYNPSANSKSIIISGNARFTVLTANIIRIEYSSTQRFEDRATLAIINRNLTVPNFSISNTGGLLTITTDSIQLSYSIGQSFSSSSLNVKSINASSSFTHWSFGMTNSGSRNLLGTIRSLDELSAPPLNCTENAKIMVHNESLHCEWGLISRDGWALINETQVPTLDNTNDQWWNGTSTDEIDLYLLTHGNEYKKALYEFTLLGGKIAMIPRYMSGSLFSEWYNLNLYDTQRTVKDYFSRQLPLDVYILDMNWHTKNDWTGYTWDNILFPYPQTHLEWIHRQGLANAANLHDADGVGPWEAMYSQMCTVTGTDPKSQVPIPFSVVNKTISLGLEDIVLQDLETQGYDFWWTDWQQGGAVGGAEGGKQNPTIWLNHLRSTDKLRRKNSNLRGTHLGRWGGLGNHRYQVGFSGDVLGVDWRSLAYQPYFSLTASNVGFGFWSHDIVGPPQNHELHVRWIQFGALSGTFRTHDRGLSAGPCNDDPNLGCYIVKVWLTPNKYFEIMRTAIQLRATLIPYIYSAHREAFDTGVSILRPMYYEYPTLSMAYATDPEGNFAQYFFGGNLVVAPIVSPAQNYSMTEKRIWVPPGYWFEENSGIMYNGQSNGNTINKLFDLSEIPRLIREGAIIPMIPLGSNTLGLASKAFTTLNVKIYPSSTTTASGSTRVYEDDGRTTAYLNNEFTWITLSYTRNSTNLLFTANSEGTFTGAPSSRTFIIEIINSGPPNKVTILGPGFNIPYSLWGGSDTWSYDGNSLSVKIEITGISQQLNVLVESQPIDTVLFNGIKGGIMHGILAKVNLDEARETPGSQTGSKESPDISELASFGNKLLYEANNITKFQSTLSTYSNVFQRAVTCLQNAKVYDPNRLKYSQALLASVTL